MCVEGQQCPERVAGSSGPGMPGGWRCTLLSGQHSGVGSQQALRGGNHAYVGAHWTCPEIRGGEGLCRGLSYWREKAVILVLLLQSDSVCYEQDSWRNSCSQKQQTVTLPCLSISVPKPISIQSTLEEDGIIMLIRKRMDYEA